MGTGRLRGVHPPAGGRGRVTAPAAAGTASNSTDRSVEVDDDGRLVHPLLAASPELSLWRAPTDNDRIGGLAARWSDWGVDRLERRLGPSSAPARRPGRRRPYSPPAARSSSATSATFTALAGGGIPVDERITIPPTSTTSPASGRSSRSCPGSRASSGSGRGRTRPTRIASAAAWSAAGPRRSRTSRPVHPAAGERRPGRRPLARARRGGAGRGLRIDLDRPLQVSATHLRAADLAAATHDVDLVARPETIVHLDVAHRGLGTASCGPDTLPEYLVGRARTPGPGRCADIPGGVTVPIEWRADDRQLPPPQRPHQPTSSGPRGRRARPPPPRAALAAGRSYRTSARRRSPGSRTASATRSPLEYPTPGSGDYRVPALVVEQPTARPSLEPRATPATGSSPGKPALAGPARRPTPRPTTRRTRSRSPSPTTAAGSRSTSRTRSSATVPAIARSARIRNGGRGARPPDSRDERCRSTCPTPTGSSSS